MRSIWKGAIGFGLVNIPVKLFSAVQNSHLDLDMLDSKDHSRIKFQRINESTKKEVPFDKIVKGYLLNEQYVIVEDQDFEDASPEKTKLMAQAKHRKLGNVTFITTVSKSDIFKYILAADAGTSVLKRTEIFKTVYSNKTFDYFACQKPVLLAINGISRQLIEDAQAGLYIEPENPGDFAKKVLLYLENPALAELHGRNGYVYARQFFDRAHLAQKYLQYIENMQGTQSQTPA